MSHTARRGRHKHRQRRPRPNEDTLALLNAPMAFRQAKPPPNMPSWRITLAWLALGLFFIWMLA